MKDQSPNTRYICIDVRIIELNDTLPRKGVLREGTRRGVYWHKNQKLQITPLEIRIREEGLSRY